jgi:hypothetical protein
MRRHCTVKAFALAIAVFGSGRAGADGPAADEVRYGDRIELTQIATEVDLPGAPTIRATNPGICANTVPGTLDVVVDAAGFGYPGASVRLSGTAEGGDRIHWRANQALSFCLNVSGTELKVSHIVADVVATLSHFDAPVAGLCGRDFSNAFAVVPDEGNRIEIEGQLGCGPTSGEQITVVLHDLDVRGKVGRALPAPETRLSSLTLSPAGLCGTPNKPVLVVGHASVNLGPSQPLPVEFSSSDPRVTVVPASAAVPPYGRSVSFTLSVPAGYTDFTDVVARLPGTGQTLRTRFAVSQPISPRLGCAVPPRFYEFEAVDTVVLGECEACQYARIGDFRELAIQTIAAAAAPGIEQALAGPARINRLGMMAGAHWKEQEPEGFLAVPSAGEGAMTEVRFPGLALVDVNTAGAAVGARYLRGVPEPVLIAPRGSAPRVLAPGLSGRAVAIDDGGRVVGHLGGVGQERAFLYDGALAVLDVPGAKASVAAGINQRGQIAGSALVDGRWVPFRAVAAPGAKVELFPIPADYVEARAVGIDDAGVIIGTARSKTGGALGFRLSAAQGFEPLDKLVAGGKLAVGEALSINARGEILVRGARLGVAGTYLLTPEVQP